MILLFVSMKLKQSLSTDSVNVRFSLFGTHLGNLSYEIQQGDSIFLSGFSNVMGGIPPLNYLWQPNHGLSDSTSPSFWAKPEYSVAYYVTVTDSAGCSATGSPVYYVTVLPISTNQYDFKKPIEIYPNPARDHITFKTGGAKPLMKTLIFYNNQGKVIHRLESNEECIRLKTSSLSNGLNFYKIFTSDKIIDQGKIIVH